MGELYRQAKGTKKAPTNTDRARAQALAILGERTDLTSGTNLRQDLLDETIGWDDLPDGWTVDPKGTGRLVRAEYRPAWKGDEITTPGFEALSGKYTIYFAYGSNLHMAQMERRCPDAIPLGRAILQDWRLRWNGVLTIEESKGQDVWGALWATKEMDERNLDRYEGCDKECGKDGLYRKVRISVHDASGRLWTPYVYIMNRGRESYPAPHYLQTCVTGAVHFGIPVECLTQYLPRR